MKVFQMRDTALTQLLRNILNQAFYKQIGITTSKYKNTTPAYPK